MQLHVSEPNPLALRELLIATTTGDWLISVC